MSPRQSTFETAQLVLELGRSYAVKTVKHISGLNEPWDFFFLSWHRKNSVRGKATGNK